MEGIRAALEEMFPQRAVTRDFKDPALRFTEDLRRGVYTLLSGSEGNFTNSPGYSAQDGRHEIVLVADIEIGSIDTPSVVEDAEFVMIDEIKQFVRNLPATLCTLNLMSWTQSGQVAAPRGWVIFQLEYIP